MWERVEYRAPVAQMIRLCTAEELRTAGCWLEPPAQPIFFSKIDDSHSDRIHASLTAPHCFNNGYLGKQHVAWEEHCVEYQLKELQERMDRCTGHHNMTEIILKTALNTIQSISNVK